MIPHIWKYATGALAALSIGLVVSNSITTSQRDTARAERDNLSTQLSAVSDLLETQNRAVDNLRAAADANREVYLAGLEAANRKAVRLEIKAEDYLNTPIPSDPAEACEVADQILTEVTR